MDPELTDDERSFRREVDHAIGNEIRRSSQKWKKEGTTPREFYKALGNSWLLGYRWKDAEIKQIPWSQNIYFYRELARISGGLAIAAFVHSQTGLKAIHAFGTKDHWKHFLLPGMSGEKILAIANTEPGAGSDAASISLDARDMGDHFLLNGTKSYITSGDIADAVVLTAVTDPQAERPHKGISMFLVDGELEGLERLRMKKYGWDESHLSTLIFKDVKVPKERLMGKLNRGFYQTMEVFNSSRIGIAAIANWSAMGAIKMALDYNKKREIFGRTVFDHGTKRSEYADRITMLQAGWLMVQKAARMHDMGEDFSYYASMAKLFNTEEGMRISQFAAMNFGARGYLQGHPISQYPLDSSAALMGEGAPEVQRKIIAENIDEILMRM